MARRKVNFVPLVTAVLAVLPALCAAYVGAYYVMLVDLEYDFDFESQTRYPRPSIDSADAALPLFSIRPICLTVPFAPTTGGANIIPSRGSDRSSVSSLALCRGTICLRACCIVFGADRRAAGDNCNRRRGAV
jgi:hypothetical protein